ncbi:vegetative cell wall protein gp1 [Lontra canadensis]|uniref:vegetative cell wall protein gp1 n=1 Tax=Lontra canadensis TaxID=76717 RepID=UPI0013F35F86|nr:vegetative cell wall protein gp1 [Lontra canadensis]
MSHCDAQCQVVVLGRRTTTTHGETDASRHFGQGAGSVLSESRQAIKCLKVPLPSLPDPSRAHGPSLLQVSSIKTRHPAQRSPFLRFPQGPLHYPAQAGPPPTRAKPLPSPSRHLTSPAASPRRRAPASGSPRTPPRSDSLPSPACPHPGLPLRPGPGPLPHPSSPGERGAWAPARADRRARSARAAAAERGRAEGEAAP